MDNRPESVNVTRTDKAGDEVRVRQIRAEIEQTRDELSETVDAIQEKLRPSNIASSAATATTEKVKNMTYSAADTAGDWWEASGGNRMIARVKNNPIPAAMAGIGLAWLWFGGNGRRHRSDQYRAEPYRSEYATRPWRESPEGDHSLLDSASEMTARSGDMMRRGRRSLGLMIRDYPLAVGAAAAVLGATLGLVVPETERENELMGEARDNAVERAQEAATGAASRVKEAAADVVTRAVTGD